MGTTQPPLISCHVSPTQCQHPCAPPAERALLLAWHQGRGLVFWAGKGEREALKPLPRAVFVSHKSHRTPGAERQQWVDSLL